MYNGNIVINEIPIFSLSLQFISSFLPLANGHHFIEPISYCLNFVWIVQWIFIIIILGSLPYMHPVHFQSGIYAHKGEAHSLDVCGIVTSWALVPCCFINRTNWLDVLVTFGLPWINGLRGIDCNLVALEVESSLRARVELLLPLHFISAYQSII